MAERDPAQISPLQTQIMQQLTQGQGQGVYGAPDAFDFTTEPTDQAAELWEWRKRVEDGDIGDTFDFTTEPTAPEPVTSIESKMMNNRLGGDDLPVDPSNPNAEWPIGPIPEVPDIGLLLPAHDDGLLLPY